MTELLYEIQMHTLIGIKYGSMYAKILDDEVKGIMNLMKQSTSFYGKINKNGDCEIQGQIISLTKTIPYQAIGKIKKETVELDMHTNQGEFHIAGKGTQNEKILQLYC
ncbi:hypothetical protein [Eubacterium oxidoreducens]|uniref:Uncharacterized protein n=1 Tax=Eubacterium oxidoreducens TaxID=1732 RepID=A0A1G6BXN0_EUBOX|nr:hypothetical protein [Eubacterium oxidoreducens]SDB25297.1 hypothetical protein SAMN02910417_01880 [Eubacterium oxidoreducens]